MTRGSPKRKAEARWPVSRVGCWSRSRASCVMTHAFDFEEPVIHLVTELPETAKVVEAFGEVEVFRVIDGRLGSEGVLLFEILLHVRGLVLDVETGMHPVGDHAGAIAGGRWWRCAGDAQRKQQAHAIGTAEIEILANDRFEKLPALDRLLEHLGETDLELPDLQF